MNATNRLYHNEVSGLEEALDLFRVALANEASAMRTICEPGDDFPDRLTADAAAVQKLQAEYAATVKVAEAALVQRWLESGDEIARQVAAAAQADDWSILAL